MGNVTALYTAEGTLVGTYEYDPYGKLLAQTPNEAYDDTDGILAKNPFRYRGYYYDRETGWYYLQSRYYDPEVKRFINADSTDLLTNDCMNLMQYNLFMYCNGDPVNYADFSGYTAVAIAIGTISITNLGAITIAAAPYILVVAGVAVIGIIVYGVIVNAQQQNNNNSQSSNPQSQDAPTHNEGEAKAPKTGEPNSEYVQKDRNGNVRSKTVYDHNGRPRFRDDFDHAHYDKNSHQLLQPHRHYWRYNNNGQVIEKGVQPIPYGGVR